MFDILVPRVLTPAFGWIKPTSTGLGTDKSVSISSSMT